MMDKNKYTCKTCGRVGLRYSQMICRSDRPPDTCKECKRDSAVKYRLDYPERYRVLKIQGHRKYKYGVSKERYKELLEIHLHGCAICKKPKRLEIDHNHKTRKVRGLLCHNCNAALGFLKEDEGIIWSMLEYLKKYSEEVA